MTKEEYIKELDKKLDRLSLIEKENEIKQVTELFDNALAKGISYESVVESLGDVDELVKTIYLKKEKNEFKTDTINEKKSIKEELIGVWENLKKIFKSKDKKSIIKSMGNILYTIFVAIIIKVPFIFVKTLLLDFLNNNDVSYTIQNVISGCVEFIYLGVAIIVLYKHLKKYFGKN